jgi:hypothetical protein
VIDRCAGTQQHFDAGQVAILRRDVERGPASLISRRKSAPARSSTSMRAGRPSCAASRSGVDPASVRASSGAPARKSSSAHSTRPRDAAHMQRRPLSLVAHASICTRLQQQLHTVAFSGLCSQQKRRPALARARVLVRPSTYQKRYALALSVHGGKVERRVVALVFLRCAGGIGG